MKNDENDMIVYLTKEYNESINKDGLKVVNQIFVIHKELGSGSFWQAYLVKRNYIVEGHVDTNWYVFKEGLLSIKDDVGFLCLNEKMSFMT